MKIYPSPLVTLLYVTPFIVIFTILSFKSILSDTKRTLKVSFSLEYLIKSLAIKLVVFLFIVIVFVILELLYGNSPLYETTTVYVPASKLIFNLAYPSLFVVFT